ncbi:hypothetical protein BC834DRAFT_676615 [Gloeopeniophorella convolvens]|nr:hypothetical protein BC834DRAFT_676615 [Gloeopeniophorella convolvens]
MSQANASEPLASQSDVRAHSADELRDHTHRVLQRHLVPILKELGLSFDMPRRLAEAERQVKAQATTIAKLRHELAESSRSNNELQRTNKGLLKRLCDKEGEAQQHIGSLSNHVASLEQEISLMREREQREAACTPVTLGPSGPSEMDLDLCYPDDPDLGGTQSTEDQMNHTRGVPSPTPITADVDVDTTTLHTSPFTYAAPMCFNSSMNIPTLPSNLQPITFPPTQPIPMDIVMDAPQNSDAHIGCTTPPTPLQAFPTRHTARSPQSNTFDWSFHTENVTANLAADLLDEI